MKPFENGCPLNMASWTLYFQTNTPLIEDFIFLKARLKNAIYNAINCNSHKNFGILFSGGLDSCLIAKMAIDLGKTPIAYTIGTKNSTDIRQSVIASNILNIEHRIFEYSEQEVEEAFVNLVKLSDTEFFNVQEITVNSILLAAASKTIENTILVGLGADTLFGGFKKYSGSYNIHTVDCKIRLLIMFKTLENCFEWSSKIGRSIKYPFLDEDVIRFSLATPEKYKVNKLILREIAKDLNLPESIFAYKKHAAQYGTGFDKVLAKLSKNNTKSDYFTNLKKREGRF